MPLLRLCKLTRVKSCSISFNRNPITHILLMLYPILKLAHNICITLEFGHFLF